MSRLIYFGLVALSAVEAYLMNNRFGYLPLLFLIFLLPVDVVCTVGVWRKLRGGNVEPECREYGRGDPAEFTCSFENASSFLVGRLRVYFVLTGPDGLGRRKKRSSLCVAPKAAGTFYLCFAPQHIGIYRVNVKKAVIYGPLGLFGIRLNSSVPGTALAVPACGAENAAEAALARREEDSSAKADTGREEEEIYCGVREYAPGDPIRSIHWKLSAHSRKLMTRLSERTGENCFTVAVDFRPPAAGGEEALCRHDLVCETAFRELRGHVEQGEFVRLTACTGKQLCTEEIHSEEGVAEAAAVLALSERETEAQAGDVFPPETCGAAVVSALLDEKLARQLAVLAAAGKGAAYFYIAPPGGQKPETVPFAEKLAKNGVAFAEEKTVLPEETAVQLKITRR